MEIGRLHFYKDETNQLCPIWYNAGGYPQLMIRNLQYKTLPGIIFYKHSVRTPKNCTYVFDNTLKDCPDSSSSDDRTIQWSHYFKYSAYQPTRDNIVVRRDNSLWKF